MKNLKWLLLSFWLVTMSTAVLADASDLALIYIGGLQQEARLAVKGAQERMRGAEQTLEQVRAVEADVRNSRDSAAIAIAREAVAEAEHGVREARRLLDRANAFLAQREKQLLDTRVLVSRQKFVGGVRGTVFALDGEVKIFDKDGNAVTDSVRPLQVGDRVVTGKDGSARLILAGGDADALLEPGSAMTITEDSLDAGFLGDLEMGWVKVRAKLVRYFHRFEVRIPVAVCAVRGTEFSVNTLPEGVRVSVTEGVVLVTPNDPDARPVELRPGEEREWTRSGGWGPVRPAGKRVDWGD
jgi:hypothetical protein